MLSKIGWRCCRIEAEEDSQSEHTKLKDQATTWHIFCLCVTAVICGEFTGWSTSLNNGFGSFIASTLVLTCAYIVFISCLAEMSSAIPFSGGSYGFARAALGLVPAFLVGVAETQEYIFAVSIGLLLCGEIMTKVTGLNENFEYLWFIILTVFPTWVHIKGGLFMWRSMVFITVVSMGTWLVLILGSFAQADVSYAALKGTTNPWWTNGASALFDGLPPAVWWYLGVEMLVLTAEETAEPRKTVPKSLLMSIGFFAVVAPITLVMVCVIPPGIDGIMHSEYPLVDAFAAIFPRAAPAGLFLVTFIPAFGDVIGFMYGYGRQMYSLARAGLFPRFIARTGSSGTPYAALCIGSAVALIATFVAKNINNGVQTMLNLSIVGGLANFMISLISYIVLKIKYPTIIREFKSPFGLPGAICTLMFFTVTLVSFFIYQPGMGQAAGVTACWMTVAVIYHFGYARSHMLLSPEEKFALYMRVNARRMLATGVGLTYLSEYCKRENSSEAVECWQAIREFNSKPTMSKYNLIYLSHLHVNANKQVNVSSDIYRRATDYFYQLGAVAADPTTPGPSMDTLENFLVEVQASVERMLDQDTIPRFKKSNLFPTYLAQDQLMFKVEPSRTSRAQSHASPRNTHVGSRSSPLSSEISTDPKNRNHSSIRGKRKSEGVELHRQSATAETRATKGSIGTLVDNTGRSPLSQQQADKQADLLSDKASVLEGKSEMKGEQDGNDDLGVIDNDNDPDNMNNYTSNTQLFDERPPTNEQNNDNNNNKDNNNDKKRSETTRIGINLSDEEIAAAPQPNEGAEPAEMAIGVIDAKPVQKKEDVLEQS